MKMKKSLAQKLSVSKCEKPLDNAPHIIVQALAGTGKTTTLLEGIKIVKGLGTNLTPSPQQQAVWDAMELSKDHAKTIGFVAFNKSISQELQQRVPSGVEAMTLHSLGFKAVLKTFDRVKVENNRVSNIICEITGKDIWELRKKNQVMLSATQELVNLCKMNLVNYDDNIELFQGLASNYDIDLNGSRTEVFELVPRVLELCMDVAKDKCLDFSDMIWLPTVLNLQVSKYDLLLVDERQDLSRCQQALALMSGQRIVAVGDSHQSIYGFCGADAEACANLKQLLLGTGREVIELPLTVTRRCGKAIVKEAQKFVPEFEAHESCVEGKVYTSTLDVTRYKGMAGDGTGPIADGGYTAIAKSGDMVLCRTNAPLISECFKFLKQGRKAIIAGRDIGQGLIKLINKLEKKADGLTAYTIANLVSDLEQWYKQESEKELAKRNPSDAKLASISDKHDCLQCFCEDAATVKEVTDKIERIFSDTETDGIRLSSGHKSKGLEAKRVFILQLDGGYQFKPKNANDAQQEINLRYVMCTRAIEELVYVSGKIKKPSLLKSKN